MSRLAVARIRQEPDLAEIIAILQKRVGAKLARVVLFGSRARGDAGAGSDIDMAVQCDGDVGLELAEARDDLESSNIPYEVDLVDMKDAPPAVLRRIQAEGVELWTR
jgi:uncharacterized protein